MARKRQWGRVWPSAGRAAAGVTTALALTGALAISNEVESVAINDITREPARYIGKRVSVTGELDKAIDPRAISLTDDRFFENTLPVVGKKDSEVPFEKDMKMRVTGVVRMMNVAEAEKLIGRDLNVTEEALFHGEVPVLVVENLGNFAKRKPASVTGEPER